MRKFYRLMAAAMIGSIALFSACSETEAPIPSATAERLDDLWNELRDLKLKVYGEQW